MSPKQALAFVEKHGVVLQAARGTVPSLAEAVAGERIRGSWWGHPKGQQIFLAAQAVCESPDVLVCKLVDGKVTYVHRRLWPALVKLASAFPRAGLAKVWNEHTAGGAHRARRVAFPAWVPADVARRAEALPLAEAQALLSRLLAPGTREPKVCRGGGRLRGDHGEVGDGMKRESPRGFSGAAEFRAWLAKNHDTATELFVRCSKAHVAGGLTYRQALDEALCIGWIDGVRHGVDESSFSVRFTPRKPRSEWSTVNIRRYRELLAEDRVKSPGRKAFAARVKSQYSFESRPRTLAPAYRRAFRSSERAWAFFEAQPPWYRRTCSFWVMSAKHPETRERRLAQLISRSERGEGVPPLKRPRARTAGGHTKRARP